MRVISGIARGHNLLTPEGLDTRPTTDRIKETLFNIIAFDLPECEFLDLFAGSGAIGIEALSRGAKRATFIDKSEACTSAIIENLEHTKLMEKAEVLKKDIDSGIAALCTEKVRFDIIFMDPPYENGLIMPTLKAIVNSKILKEDGYVIVERSSKVPLLPVDGMKIIREKEYRTTVMTFLSLEENTKC